MGSDNDVPVYGKGDSPEFCGTENFILLLLFVPLLALFLIKGVSGFLLTVSFGKALAICEYLTFNINKLMNKW